MAKTTTAVRINDKTNQSPEGAPWLSKVRSKCPAIILAANRTDRVKGRIILLIISITTIKGIRAGGVPKGTKCASILWGVLTQAIIICPNHKGRAIARVKERWLEAVKM